MLSARAITVTPTGAKGFVKVELNDLKGGLATEILEVVSSTL